MPSLSGEVRGRDVLAVLIYLHHAGVLGVPLFLHGRGLVSGGNDVADDGHDRGGFPAPAAPALPLVHPAQREKRRDANGVGFPAAGEVDAADPVSCSGLESAEAAAHPGPRNVLQPYLSLSGVLRKGVEPQIAIPVRVIVASGHAAREAGHDRVKDAPVLLQSLGSFPNFVLFGSFVCCYPDQRPTSGTTRPTILTTSCFGFKCWSIDSRLRRCAPLEDFAMQSQECCNSVFNLLDGFEIVC